MDGDDEIAGIENLPRLIEDYSRLAAANPTYAIQLMFPYEYDYDPYGNCFVRFMRERLHNRMEEHAQDGHKSVWQWCDPIHETIFAVPRGGTVPVMRIENVAMTWKHRRAGSGKDSNASLTRNLKVLEAWAIHYAELQEKNSAIPNHYRLEFYYALTLHQLNVRLDEAVSHYKRAMDVAQSDDDVAMTAMKMSQLLVQLGRHREAIAYANMMIHVHETWGEGYFLAAKAYYYKAQAAGGSQHDWERCIHFGVLGLQMPPTQTIHIVDPQERANIYSYLIRAYDMLSRYDKALECAEKALQVYPADAGLRFNQRLFQGVIWGNEITVRMGDIARIVGEAGPGETNLFNVIRSLIERMKGHPLLGAILPNEIPGSNGPVFPKPPALRDDGKLRILIACGHSAEVWNPDILRGSGFGGGSETAVVEMSTRLAALGHFVKVITNCGEAKEYNGVHWENPDYLNHADLAVDVCIVWRMANLLDSPVAMHARIRVLWLHDTVAHFATKENMAKVDYVFTLSKWHRDHIAAEYAGIGLRDEQVIQTRTAVPNIERFNSGALKYIPRDPYKFIWTSSLDRGLDIMLKMWPNIIGRYPQATLHIFYGFESWEKYHPDDTRIPALKAMIANLAEWGVTLRARVTPAQLAEEYLSAGVWAYPNRVFPEIACVSLYEAQVAGCAVVTSDLAALGEGVCR
jgi:tetratricopeptide (TPR) repeat protein